MKGRFTELCVVAHTFWKVERAEEVEDGLSSFVGVHWKAGAKSLANYWFHGPSGCVQPKIALSLFINSIIFYYLFDHFTLKCWCTTSFNCSICCSQMKCMLFSGKKRKKVVFTQIFQNNTFQSYSHNTVKLWFCWRLSSCQNVILALAC